MNAVEKRIDKNEARLDKMEADSLRTDVAILKVEVTGLNKKMDVQSAEVEFLKSKSSVSQGITSTWKWIVGVGLVVLISGIGLVLQFVQAAGH